MATTMGRNAPQPIRRRDAAKKGPWPVEFYRSLVGKNWVMAVTGLMLTCFGEELRDGVSVVERR